MTGRRLLMWDIDWTLLFGGGVARQAYRAAFLGLAGRDPLVELVFAGRADLDTMAEALALEGVGHVAVAGFLDRYAAEFAARAHLLTESGYPLPGAREVLGALAGRADLVQTTVTGNIAPVAHAKLAAFDLADPLDLSVGGYGDEHPVRAALVAASRERARARYGDFADVIVIGDTPYDIAAALACGVTAIGVATGATSAEELRAAGAHAVLDSLADTVAAVALLGS
jgi:phosphoglycolate phosphatase